MRATEDKCESKKAKRSTRERERERETERERERRAREKLNVRYIDRERWAKILVSKKDRTERNAGVK